MVILAFDTTQKACSVAISHRGHLLANEFKTMKQGHAENLLPMIERVRKRANISYNDLEIIAVTTGPGTFTGVRVGLAAARALTLALDISIIGVSTFEVLVQDAILNFGDKGLGIIASIEDRRRQIYTQTFDALGKPVTEPAIYNVEHRMPLNASKPGIIIGSGAAILQSVLSDWRINENILEPDAANLAIAAEDWEDRVSRYPPAPIYMRAPDANLSAAVSVGSIPK